MMLEKGRFPIPVEIDGRQIQDFTLRAAIMADTVAAIESVPSDSSNIRLTLAIMARRVSLEGVSQELITPDFLMNLLDINYQAIEQARERLEKKLEALSST